MCKELCCPHVVPTELARDNPLRARGLAMISQKVRRSLYLAIRTNQRTPRAEVGVLVKVPEENILTAAPGTHQVEMQDRPSVVEGRYRISRLATMRTVLHFAGIATFSPVVPTEEQNNWPQERATALRTHEQIGQVSSSSKPASLSCHS
eukprot:gb/GEZN01011712.1/.p1 GENE.gb/GEZN01011712.1/~~gb/GEZN01011712.1/.p1  ORF type:complete len:149 (-),score=6.30 gb/GEZN01011712.1/:241-687(-)